jgi:hypothetical protein
MRWSGLRFELEFAPTKLSKVSFTPERARAVELSQNTVLCAFRLSVTIAHGAQTVHTNHLTPDSGYVLAITCDWH